MTLACPTAQTFRATAAWATTDDCLPAAPLDFVVVGLNHQTAPLEVREQVAVRPDQMDAILGRLAPFAREVMLLSTCNRTEIYLAGLDWAGVQGDPRRAFEACFEERSQNLGAEVRPHLYMYQQEQAAQHLYRVTAGLDSLVIGETQIQGQVKRAWQDSHQRQLCGTLLNKAAQGALATGKRVRSETGMSDKVVSVSSAAVALAQAALGELTGRSALILGAGETAELTLTHLRSAGVGDVVVVNRTEARAQQLAEKLGGRAAAYERLNDVLAGADIVIASSAAPHYVLSGPQVRRALQSRPDRPLFLVDISLPRILNPNISEVTGAHLHNLDDLTHIVQTNLSSRREAVPHAEAIVREMVSDLSRWNLTRHAQMARQNSQHQSQQHKQQQSERALAAD